MCSDGKVEALLERSVERRGRTGKERNYQHRDVNVAMEEEEKGKEASWVFCV